MIVIKSYLHETGVWGGESSLSAEHWCKNRGETTILSIKILSIQNAHTPHVFTWFRTVCNILTIRYLVELLFAFNWMFYVHKQFGDFHFGVKPTEILMIWLGLAVLEKCCTKPPEEYDKTEKWYLLLSEVVCPECAKKKNYGKAQMKAWTTVKEQRTQEHS